MAQCCLANTLYKRLRKDDYDGHLSNEHIKFCHNFPTAPMEYGGGFLPKTVTKCH